MASDIRVLLRKYEFPNCAKEALYQLEQLCVARNCGPQQQRFMQDIMEEFIFCEAERRGIKKKRLSAIQELQLLDVLAAYLESQKSDVTCNTVFLTLFHYEGGNLMASNKMKILAKLVSLGIATKNVVVLGCSAVWMQQQGCTSDVVVNLIQELVSDYFILVPKAFTVLQDLPQISPSFTTNFITGVTALYSIHSNSMKNFSCPDALLTMITDWVSSNNRLCLTPLVTNLHTVLPRGSLVMPALTPLKGLIQWCVTASLWGSTDSNASEADSNNIKVNGFPPSCGFNYSTKKETFSHLHLGILETMLEAEKVRPTMVQKDVMLMRDVITICDDTLAMINLLANNLKPQDLQDGLDRLGRSIQVALFTGCLQGNLDDLFKQLMKFPNNRLLKMIIQHHRKT